MRKRGKKRKKKEDNQATKGRRKNRGRKFGTWRKEIKVDGKEEKEGRKKIRQRNDKETSKERIFSI